MGTKAYRPQRDDYVPDGSEVLDDHPHTIARELLLPRIAARNKKAVKTIRTELYYFAKIRAGRRCSCFESEIAPDSLCSACFSTGIVGGYLKYGTDLFTLDVTHPNIRSVNVIPNHEIKEKPTPLTLVDGSTFGFAEFTVQLGTNIGLHDAFLSITKAPDGSSVDAFLKSPADQTYVAFTKQNFDQRLLNHTLQVRIELRRPNAASKTPRFYCLHGRYRRISDLKLTANVPRTERSQFLGDHGLTDQWQSQHFFLDNTIKNITTEDFVATPDGQTRWKIHNVNPFDPENQLLSWDVDTRLVHPYESYNYVPL